MKIGVLALQGAVAEHIRMLEKSGVEAIAIKKTEQLNEIAGLVLPGGESTAIGKLMREYGFIEPIKELAKSGFPLFGTCAGLIIIAGNIEHEQEAHLGLMDIHVQRNAFGRQRESFEVDLHIKNVADDFRAVFIRAPLILEVGSGVEVLATHGEQIVAAKQDNFLAASFHPELTDDERFHQYFVNMVQEYVNQQTKVTHS
ncbi:pyridoxal 5'-phosphate synthase glutaminase subunit PdxT [Caldalkalibacillus mannanilyticus]|uniref:pyridoxal 5'-phosphate synthase glutaminase subunit PdxT n=1 Tax=Caldalkalibacillus mannanilyticus TaxID=1418 RepID=UPI000468EFC8|nr:pyridoxal 5'-phosphate synthase glutaminase subunit PdxT [Caldalkalibacillus mannanilyticus]